MKGSNHLFLIRLKLTFHLQSLTSYSSFLNRYNVGCTEPKVHVCTHKHKHTQLLAADRKEQLVVDKKNSNSNDTANL